MLPAWATSEHKHFLRFGADHFRPAAWRQAFRASRAADSAEKRSPPRSFRQDLPAPGHRSHRHTSILWALSPVPAARARPAARRNSLEHADRSRSGRRSNWPAAPHHGGPASRPRQITTTPRLRRRRRGAFLWRHCGRRRPSRLRRGGWRCHTGTGSARGCGSLPSRARVAC